MNDLTKDILNKKKQFYRDLITATEIVQKETKKDIQKQALTSPIGHKKGYVDSIEVVVSFKPNELEPEIEVFSDMEVQTNKGLVPYMDLVEFGTGIVGKNSYNGKLTPPTPHRMTPWTFELPQSKWERFGTTHLTTQGQVSTSHIQDNLDHSIKLMSDYTLDTLDKIFK